MKKAILYSFIIILLSDSLIAATYYLQRNGSDSYLGTSEQQAWATFSHAIPRLRPGDELIILDGTYNQTLSISNSGTSSQALTVKAKNDGKVVIDGQNVRVPLFVSGNYVILEGIVAKNSSSDVVQIQGNYNIIRRCSAYNANPNANVHRFTITGSFNLLEDCAAGGTGRYCFLNYDCEGNTLRRCFGKWELHAGGSPRAVYSNYGAENILMENCIGFDVLPNMNTFLEYYGVYQTWASYNTHPTNHCRYYGCIFYQNLQGGFILNPSTGPHSEFIHCVIFNHNQTDPYGGHSVTQCGYGIYGSSQSQMVVRNCTFVNNSQTAVIYMGTDELTNSIFMNNGRAISGGNHRYCCFFNNSTNGVTLNSSDIQVNPSFEDDCYLYIPDSSPCKGAGKDSQDIGANVVYRYVDGVLTNEPLWPWPMNQRILDEIGYDVTGNLIPKYNYGYVEPESILLASPSS